MDNLKGKLTVAVCIGYLILCWALLWGFGLEVKADSEAMQAGVCRHPRWAQEVPARWIPCGELPDRFEPRLARK